MTETWDFVNVGGLPGFDTQIIWHAASLARSRSLDRDILLINWPNDQLICIGWNQIANLVLDLDYCKSTDLPIVRRACGGGQVLLNSDQIFYQIITHVSSKHTTLNFEKYYKTFLEPVAQTYRDFEISAEYKPLNDIVTGGRKISGNGLARFEDAQMLCGNFILDFPSADMAKIFLVPEEKFRDKIYKTLESVMSSFKRELGSSPSKDEILEKYKANFEKIVDVKLVERSLHPEIIEIMDELRPQYKTEEWLHQVDRKYDERISTVKFKGKHHAAHISHKTPGGLIRLMFIIENSKFIEVTITGDFTMHPLNSPSILEKSLVGCSIEASEIKKCIETTVTKHEIECPLVSSQDFTDAFLKGLNAIKE